MEEFQIPTAEATEAFGAEELISALEAAMAEAQALAEIPDEEMSDEQVDRLSALGNFVGLARQTASDRETAAAARTEALSAARAAVAPVEVAAVEEAPAEEPTAVVAAAPKVSAAARAAANQPEVKAPARRKALIAAGSDISGVTTGTEYDSLAAAAPAVRKVMQGIGMAKGKGRLNMLSISRNDDAMLEQTNGVSDDQLLREAGDESKLSGGNLVAAGGWGAPSQIIYDMCPFGEIFGLIDLPEVRVTRGGMQYTKGLDFEDILNSATGFWDQTEAVAIAGTELKTSIRPAEPTFVDVRLDAVGVMVEAGLLLRAGWPEVIEQTTQGALMVHQLKVATKVLNEVRTYTGAAQLLTNGAGNAIDLLNFLAIVAAGERQKQLLPENTTLETLLPFWAKNAIRADLSNRTGVDMINIPDTWITAAFAKENMRVQWLHGMQDLPLSGTQNIATAYPNTVEAIMFQAGTFVKGTADVITLDTVYDAANLKRNDYVHLFVEEGVLVANPCHDGVRVNLPLSVSGLTAAASTGEFLTAPAAI